jgi:hypothetical protein
MRNSNVPTFTYNELKLRAARYKEPPFTLEYTMSVPKALESIVNR